jgi:hypothetical protein
MYGAIATILHLQRGSVKEFNNINMAPCKCFWQGKCKCVYYIT